MKNKRRTICDFKKFITNETFYSGPGGQLRDNSDTKDKFIYKVEELTFLYDRFNTYLDKMSDDDFEKHLDKMTKSINDMHRIVNDIMGDE